jgi:hypothetical protein
MSHHPASISEEDSRLVEANQLGTPLGVYRMRASIVNVFRRVSLAFIVIGAVLIILVSALILGRYLLSQQQIDLVFFSPTFLAGVCSILFGLFTLKAEFPHLLNERIIVCENGLIQIRRNSVEVVHWSDLKAIWEKLGGLDYALERRGGQALVLNRFYTNFDELITLIRQRSGLP